MRKIWEIFDEEKEEEKIGVSQRMRGIGIAPETKPKSPVWDIFGKADIGIGVGVKAEADISLPEFTDPLNRIKFYKTHIDKLEAIAKEKGGLSGSGYDAYEYAIRQYNKSIEEYNLDLPKKQVDFGIEGPISKPEDKPKSFLEEAKKRVISVFGTWEAKKRAMPELQKMEDFASTVISEAVPLAQSRYGEEYSKRGSYKEEIAIIHEYLTGAPREETLKKMDANFKEYGSINPDVDKRTWLEYFKQEGLLKTLITGPTKGIYDEAEKLQYKLSDIRMRVAEPGKDFIGQVGWTGVAIVLGYQGITALYKGGMVIENRIIKGERLKQAVERIQTAYIPKTGKFKASLSNNDFRIAQALNQIVKRYGKDPLTGLTKMEVPQQVFMGQAGKITNIVKIIQSAGKLTPEATIQIKTLSPSAVTQVAAQLAPALASEFLKAVEKPVAVPEVKPVISKEEIVPELKKVIEIKEETEKAQKKIIDERVLELKEEGFKGVEKGGLKRDEEGRVIGRYPAVSLNPKWYREFYAENKKAPNLTDLKEIAKEQLLRGHEEDYGIVPPNEIYQKIDSQIEIYNTIIETLKVIPKEPIKPVLKPEVKREAVKVPKEVSELLKAEAKYPEKFAKEEIKEFKKFITEEEDEFIKAEREYPAKIIKEEVEELKPLATPVQIKEAHVIARDKALISEKGKMKPQYREIAKAFTDQKSIKDMTKEEAEVFIDALNKLPEPKYRAGKLVPPSIPRTTKLVPEGFFQKEYGEPTPIWLLKDQTYYATQLGIHPLVAPFEKGKQEFDLEFRLSSKLVDRMVNKLNDIAGTSAFAKIKSKVKNIPTKAESKMAELVNKYEATPPGLKPKEEDVFKYFRNLSKDIWRRENEVREKVDLPPIKYKTAYFRHTADAMAKEMLEGKYPFPQGIKYWGEKMVGKKIFNPMEFHRKLSDDLIDIWSKDIRAVTKAMLWSGLKEIYLAQPAKFLNEQLNAISKDLPEYKNLSPRDQAAYDQTRVIPASTRKWLIDYINQVLKGQETELDASLNRIVTNSGLKGLFDKVLSPFGRSVGRKPITHLFMLSGRAIISGVMGWVPRQILRNSFQPVQNLALYGVKATIKAYLPASIDKNLKGLMSESLFLKSYTGFEELPTNLMGKLEKIWLGPYGIVAVNNAKLGMKAAYWNTIELIRNPKFRKHGWADPQRTKDTPKGFLYPSEKEKLLREMEFGSSCTQYQYIPMGMPGIFRYKALVPLTRLQSWWMNYFTKFLREATYRGLKGRPSWSGEDGPTLPWSRRVNFLKYLIIGGAILTSLGYRRSFLLGVAPVYLSPAGQLALGMYNYVTATEDWKREKALRQIYYSWKAFIPGSLAWRDFVAVWKGEKELEEILFYGKKEEKKKAVPKSDIWEDIEEKPTKPKKKSDVWEIFD